MAQPTTTKAIGLLVETKTGQKLWQQGLEVNLHLNLCHVLIANSKLGNFLFNLFIYFFYIIDLELGT